MSTRPVKRSTFRHIGNSSNSSFNTKQLPYYKKGARTFPHQIADELKIKNSLIQELDVTDSVETNKGTIINIHYKDCTINSDRDLRNYRGIVYDTTNKKIILPGFPFIPEVSSPDEIDKELPDAQINGTQINGTQINGTQINGTQINGTQIRYYSDGVILRVFRHNDRIYVSTNKKLDAYNSRWGGPTFGEIFSNTLKNRGIYIEGVNEEYPIFLDNKITLDHTLDDLLKSGHKLIFLITHNSTDIINITLDPKFYILRIYDNSNVIVPLDNYESYTLPKIVESDTKLTGLDLLSMLEESDSFETSGIMVMVPSERGITRPVKIVSKKYLEMRDIRGNVPNIVSRYLILVNDNKTKEADILLNFNKDTKHKITNALKDIDTLVDKLFDTYTKRFVDNQKLTMEEYTWNILNTIDEKYDMVNREIIYKELTTNYKLLEGFKIY